MQKSTASVLLGVWLTALATNGPALAQDNAEASRFTVTLLGTGSPPPSIERFGPSTLVEVGNQRLVFDAGRGVTAYAFLRAPDPEQGRTRRFLEDHRPLNRGGSQENQQSRESTTMV